MLLWGCVYSIYMYAIIGNCPRNPSFVYSGVCSWRGRIIGYWLRGPEAQRGFWWGRVSSSDQLKGHRGYWLAVLTGEEAAFGSFVSFTRVKKLRVENFLTSFFFFFKLEAAGSGAFVLSERGRCLFTNIILGNIVFQNNLFSQGFSWHFLLWNYIQKVLHK